MVKFFDDILTMFDDILYRIIISYTFTGLRYSFTDSIVDSVEVLSCIKEKGIEPVVKQDVASLNEDTPIRSPALATAAREEDSAQYRATTHIELSLTS